MERGQTEVLNKQGKEEAWIRACRSFEQQRQEKRTSEAMKRKRQERVYNRDRQKHKTGRASKERGTGGRQYHSTCRDRKETTTGGGKTFDMQI